MSKDKEQDSSPRPDIIKEKIIHFFKSYKNKAYSIKQLAKKLNVRNKEELAAIIDGLALTGNVSRLKNGTYKSGTATAGNSNIIITGRVDYVNPRFAFIISEDIEEDIWVNSTKLNFAMDGDIVKAMIYPQKGKRAEGEVVEILQRKKDQFVGKIEIAPRFAFVIPDNRKMHFDIFIPLERTKNAKNGQKVIAKITEWPGKNNKNPVGIVAEILGESGDNDVEMHSIMAEYGLPFNFQKQVVEEAEKISSEISQSEIKQRRDFRNITTFTIDPVDAKDFDDALSIQKTDNGTWEIGIHIADVTHYVRPDTILDKEAFSRATSVYLVDRVVPMLPEKLSNNLCSLRPNEDKLTFSAVFELDNNANIISEWYGKTIIHSDKRFAYEDVQQIIEEKKGEFSEEIHVLNDLAHKLRKDRFKKGAIAFETVEVKFQLDEKGKPLAVIQKVRKDAHKLIEDFMLLANRKVAEFVHFMRKGKDKNTMVFRIHDHPNTDKLNALAIFAKKFGHQIDLEKEDLSNALNKLVEDVEGKPEQNVLQSLAIRTMAKAKYSTQPEIHFGLAYMHYTHFTSPIRRYPDMMVHRLLEHYLNGGKSADKEEYEELCQHSSEMEKLAAEAERSSIKYKQVEYMQTMMGREFEGIVSGVIEFGLFVEIIETKCEGMVRLSELGDDHYEFDADNYRIVGKRNKKVLTLGDHVNVKILRTDLERRTIDLTFV